MKQHRVWHLHSFMSFNNKNISSVTVTHSHTTKHQWNVFNVWHLHTFMKFSPGHIECNSYTHPYHLTINTTYNEWHLHTFFHTLQPKKRHNVWQWQTIITINNKEPYKVWLVPTSINLNHKQLYKVWQLHAFIKSNHKNDIQYYSYTRPSNSTMKNIYSITVT